ncbi:hypothetical protein QTQ03_22895 [Micromonospora sp. WMMA1363]|uniref:hypothetical protein n=1 Tax=Micromonospora sp. WMMA1363 TaxID=3053985 RepID=UPI00259CBBB9|nr:hypothetical protein [Micromonospora sp. WMMA1363]MDM4722295.1 hypothetical protein [Micromonospora sp. WMMA1363]
MDALTGAGRAEASVDCRPDLGAAGYAYRDDTGGRLLICLSDRPFPVPERTEAPIGTRGAGLMRLRGVVVLCSRSPHTALVLGADESLVRQAATALDLI